MASKGSVHLDTVLRDLGLNNRTAGAIIKCTGAAVHNWRRAKRVPARAFIVKIRTLWGVPVESWFEPVEKPARKSAKPVQVAA